jgi:crossover junction endodeoxyribonuclease RuvC
MGIDPGVSTTGLGVIECTGEHSSLIGFRPVRSNSQMGLPQRLKLIYDAINEEIRDFGPEVCAVENVFGGKHLRSALIIGQARGAAILAAVNSGIEVAEFTPAEIKISVTGNGNASKEQVQFMVKNLLKLKDRPFPLDCSDALAVALCYANRMKYNGISGKG